MPKPQFQLGGQALIEGVMMRGPTHVGAAVRRADGSIETRVDAFTSVLKKYRYLNIPFLRGIFALVEMLRLGMSYLNWSSNLALADEHAKKKGQTTAVVEDALTGTPFMREVVTADHSGSASASSSTATQTSAAASAIAPAPPEARSEAASVTNTAHAPASQNVAPKKLPLWMFLVTIAGSLALGAGLFVALPNLITHFAFEPLIGRETRPQIVALTFIEGAIKLMIFVAYVWVIGRRKQIRRVFEYHGAEHKVVYAVENGRPLTPEGARPFDTPHPRCGTGFALLTVFVSIFCYSVLPWPNEHVVRVGLRLLLMPVVAGISYEILKATVNPRLSGLAFVIMKPGMWLQRLTTEQPDDKQLEVACEAMRVLLLAEENSNAAKSTSARAKV